MAAFAFAHCSKRPWQEVAKVCQNAAVFLDGGAAEMLHWAGGVQLLGSCVGVYDLYQDPSPVARDFIAAAPYCHLVIVVTSFLHGHCSERMSQLLLDLQPLECHVFCSRSELMHAEWVPMPGEGGSGEEEEEEEGGLGAFSHYGEFQGLMRKWINRESGVRVSVSHLPLFQSEVCPGLVITPPFHSLFPLLPSDLGEIHTRLLQEGEVDCSIENLGQVDFSMLSHELQTTIRCFASALNDLMGQLDVREDIFSLGHSSRLIATQLAASNDARARRKSASQRASLVLVDRTLDLTGPASHPLESLANRILASLPRLPQHSTDVCVDMSPVSNSPRSTMLPGCLAQPQSARAQSLLKTLIFSKHKESLMEVSRCLLDVLSQEGLSSQLRVRMGRPSATQLQSFLQLFRDHPGACVSQQAVLQLACAVVQALSGEQAKHWEELSSLEKVLQLSMLDPDAYSVARQLTELVRQQLGREGGGSVTVEEVMGLAVAMFSLAEENCLDDQREGEEMKKALVDLILQFRECDADFIRELGIEKTHSHSKVLQRLSTILQCLMGLGEARDQLKHFRQLYSKNTQDPEYRPLLPQLVDAIFNTSQPLPSDVEYHSHGLADMLKSGFSLFMSSVRPRPSNHPLCLLFVVGGVTSTEVRQIREALANHKTDVHVVVGATRLITPRDVVREVLCTNHLRT